MWWGTRWRTGREVKGKLANGVGSQYHFTLPLNMVYPALLPPIRTPRLPVVDWTDTPADLNGLVRFAERQNLVSARVPSRFKRSLKNFSIKRKIEIILTASNLLFFITIHSAFVSVYSNSSICVTTQNCVCANCFLTMTANITVSLESPCTCGSETTL